MVVKRDDDTLREWADEHLVYEADMMRYAARRLRELGDDAGEERNGIIESFAIHVRCLGEFLWYGPSAQHEGDARAVFFCADDVWGTGALPPLLAKVDRRVGKEIVHLTFGRPDFRRKRRPGTTTRSTAQSRRGFGSSRSWRYQSASASPAAATCLRSPTAPARSSSTMGRSRHRRLQRRRRRPLTT